MKNTAPRAGFLNRHTDGLPAEPCKIRIVTNDVSGEHIDLCIWIPVILANYSEDNKPSEGFLGTARTIEMRAPNTKGIGIINIGFNCWEQNDSEFVYYQTVTECAHPTKEGLDTEAQLPEQLITKLALENAYEQYGAPSPENQSEKIAYHNFLLGAKSQKQLTPFSKEDVTRLVNEKSQLTQEELQFIQEALNEVFYNCRMRLDRTDLGDIDRKNTIYRKDRAEELLKKVTQLT